MLTSRLMFHWDRGNLQVTSLTQIGNRGSFSRISALLRSPECMQHEAKGHNNSSCYFASLITYLSCHKRKQKRSINTAVSRLESSISKQKEILLIQSCLQLLPMNFMHSCL